MSDMNVFLKFFLAVFLILFLPFIILFRFLGLPMPEQLFPR